MVVVEYTNYRRKAQCILKTMEVPKQAKVRRTHNIPMDNLAHHSG
jgi:hypothetical protein